MIFCSICILYFCSKTISNVNYINAKTKINIICKIHGEFQQSPSNHLSKYNCQKCAKNFKLDTIGFIEKAKKLHKDIYDYSKVNYINADTKIIIICKIHGEFTQQPDFHLNRKCGCPKCYNKSDTSQFIEKAKKLHKDIYISILKLNILIMDFPLNWKFAVVLKPTPI